MRSRRPLPPPSPRVYRLHVARSEPLGASFRRVTVVGDELAAFPAQGFDHWFRLFTLHPGQTELRLPVHGTKLWYAEWLAIPASHRPHCSNYTVREFRPDRGELDIDVVVHRHPDTGEVEGRVAIWSLAAQPGTPLGLLDQGRLFNPPADSSRHLLVAEESGLPGVEGILRSLPGAAIGTAVLEVPTADDRRPLTAPVGMDVIWVVRPPGAVPGAAALAELHHLAPPDPQTYAFAVGESALATGARRHLVALGLPPERISFSGFWKH